MLEIANIRQRLSKVLFKQIQTELPGLIKNIDMRTHECQAELTKLGSVRHTTEEQQLFLIDLSQRFQSVCRSAVTVTYDQDFFDEGLSQAAQEKLLRAVVRKPEMDFKDSLYEKGKKWTVVEENAVDSKEKTRDAAVDHVLEVLKSNRGTKLPGLPSPRLVGTLFREYSSPWAGLACEHVSAVWRALKRFLESTLHYLTPPDICDSLLKLWLDPILEQTLKDANHKLSELLLVHKREPMTINHYFSDTVYKLKQQRNQVAIKTILQCKKNYQLGDGEISAIMSAIDGLADVDMDRAAAEDALDEMQAFYKVLTSQALPSTNNS